MKKLLCVLLLGACAHVQRPEVELADVRVAGIGLKGASLIADLDVRNPNDMGAQTDSVVYELFANTSGSDYTRVLGRTYAAPIVLKGNGTTRVEVPIEFNYTDLSGPMRSIMDRGTFNYRIQGRVYLSQPFKKVLPFTKTGNVSLQGVR